MYLPYASIELFDVTPWRAGAAAMNVTVSSFDGRLYLYMKHVPLISLFLSQSDMQLNNLGVILFNHLLMTFLSKHCNHTDSNNVFVFIVATILFVNVM